MSVLVAMEDVLKCVLILLVVVPVVVTVDTYLLTMEVAMVSVTALFDMI